MIDLNKALAELEGKYGRKVEFDSRDNTFYEMVHGERKPVRIEAPSDSDDSKKEQRPWYQSNFSLEARLSPADKALRQIIIDQVDDEVCRDLAKRGLMDLRDGVYHSNTIGVCHSVWENLQETLKTRYNIDWASPRDENPDVMYD